MENQNKGTFDLTQKLARHGYAKVDLPAHTTDLIQSLLRKWMVFCGQLPERKKIFAADSGVGYAEKRPKSRPWNGTETFAFGENYVWPETVKLNQDEWLFIDEALILREKLVPVAAEISEVISMGAGMLPSEISLVLRMSYFNLSDKIVRDPRLDDNLFTISLLTQGTAVGKFWYGHWRNVEFEESQALVLPGVFSQHLSGGMFKALWHKILSTGQMEWNGRHMIELSVQAKDYPFTLNKNLFGTNTKALAPGENYEMSAEEFHKFWKRAKHKPNPAYARNY